MLIKFKDIISKHGIPKGIIHIGAHKMEERHDYLSAGINNIIWIEANPSLNLLNKLSISEAEKTFQYAITDKDDDILDFNITNNGESSSILDLNLHTKHHPHIHVTETIKVKTKRMDSLILENNIDIEKFDFLNIDIQGAELLALKGFGKMLQDIKYIYTEVNTNYIYKNCCLINEIDDYLSSFNFSRAETFLTQFEWGDALYVKKND